MARVQIVAGDMLQSDCRYICHQCNCVTRNAAGLAAEIFHKFPWANVYYKQRYGEMGRIIVSGDGYNQRFVIGMFAQYYPGKAKYIDSPLDGILARERAFATCLNSILKIEWLGSVGFPYKIGCGLAKGDWNKYLQMIAEFSEKTPAEVKIYKAEKPL